MLSGGGYYCPAKLLMPSAEWDHLKLHPCTVRTEGNFVVYISYSARDGKWVKC